MPKNSTCHRKLSSLWDHLYLKVGKEQDNLSGNMYLKCIMNAKKNTPLLHIK